MSLPNHGKGSIELIFCLQRFKNLSLSLGYFHPEILSSVPMLNHVTVIAYYPQHTDLWNQQSINRTIQCITYIEYVPQSKCSIFSYCVHLRG